MVAQKHGMLNYLDFDLFIEKPGGAYEVRAFSSSAGEATARFLPPSFPEAELEPFLLAFHQHKLDLKAIEKFGQDLFNAVFANTYTPIDNEVGGLLRKCLDIAQSSNAGLRIRLHLQAAELAKLPWEYLYDPKHKHFLCLSVKTTLMRYLSLSTPITPLAVKLPLRVMVLISTPSDYPHIDAEKEWAKLQEALAYLKENKRIEIERLENATWENLQGRLRREDYHIFHFIGHGGFDEQTQESRLVLEGENERGFLISGQSLGTLMRDESTLRLALLNVCDSARVSRDDPFAGAAQSMVQNGVPAVIAMQARITDLAAITFAREFYSALADRYPVDAALAEARKAISAKTQTPEWGIPVLYTSSPDGRILDIAFSEEPKSDDELKKEFRGGPEIGPQASKGMIAGYQSDSADGKDLLDIKKEVEALCSVIAAKGVEPPLSIGLFGDWGSGKSFFMKKMEERLEELKRAAKQAQNETAYCAHIVQIKFNAWHYIDANLWASLNTEIFERLAWALTENTDEKAEYARARLLTATADSKEALVIAEKEMAEAETKLQENEQRLSQLDASTDADIEAKLSLRTILKEAYRFAAQQPEVRQKIEENAKAINQKVEEAAKALKLDEAKTAALALKDQLRDLHGIGGQWRAIMLAIRNPKDRKIWLFFLAAVVMIPLAYSATQWLIDLVQIEKLDKIRELITGLTSAALAIVTALSPFYKRAQQALKIIEEARESNRKLIEEAKQQEKDKLLEQQTQITNEVKQAQQRVDEANAAVKTLEQQLDELRADRQMATFIRQRKESTDYSKYHGVIARVRSDFEQLSTLLANVRKDAENEEERQRGEKESNMGIKAGDDKKEQAKEQKPLLPRIDRIILYIDDLDRCPEDKVVEVLQAVHLLLAFPLFVVVVAVDSRWLLHSLKQHSKAFQGLTSEGGEMSDEERTHWQATPLNYLEKIFQIPFTLRPMEQAGFGKLIEDLVKQPEKARDTKVETETKPVEEKKKPPAVEVPKKEPDAAKSVSGVIDDKAQQPDSNLGKPDLTVQTPQSGDLKTKQATPPLAEKIEATKPVAVSPILLAIDTNPQHLEITTWEREFMVKLFTLIPSPRAAKRFVNIYRLIKASVEADHLQAFIGDATQGQYRPVLLLLAILTGYPSEATDILRDLVEQEHQEAWWEFIKDSIAQRIPQGGSGHVAGSVRESETLRWLQLQYHIESLQPLIPNNQSCTDFVAWARVVARYSFQSGRILLTSNVADNKKNQTLQLQHAA